jgi:hypothetical protein
MKINKTIGALALGLGVAVGAQAQDDTQGTPIYLTGSTAFRAQVYAALHDMGLNVSQGAANNASQFTFSGTISDTTGGHLNLTGVNGDVVTAYTSWSGSVEGVQCLIGQTPSTYENVDSGTFTFNGADLSLSDVSQASCYQGSGHSEVNFTPAHTGVTLREVQTTADATRIEATGIAVQPFCFIVDGNAQTVSNITADNFFDLYGPGQLNLNYFTGNASDSNTLVYAVGRYNLSGTRATSVVDDGGSFLNNLKQYGLSDNGTTTPGLALTDTAPPPTDGNQWVGVGNNGYYSGGNVGKAIHAASVNGVPAAVGYIAFSDSSKLTGTTTNYEGPINWMGQSAWIGGTFPNSGGWNTNGIINGSYNLWTYERMYLSPGDSGNTLVTQFGQALISAIQYEIIHTPTTFGAANNQPTAILESQMNVYRNGDGGDVSLVP